MPALTSVVDELTQPPFASLNAVLDLNGPFGTGDYNIDSFYTDGSFLLPAGSHDIGGTYGVIVQVGLVPPQVGFRIGWNDVLGTAGSGDEWERRICQLVLQHYLPLGGFWIPTLVQDLNLVSTYVAWPVLVLSGSRLGLHVDPGWSVDLYFMCVL
jgi:hypothetical protein